MAPRSAGTSRCLRTPTRARSPRRRCLSARTPYADATGQKLTAQILQVNGNINDTRGTGGSCFGDSGGPAFYPGGKQSGAKIVTVTSYGYAEIGITWTVCNGSTSLWSRSWLMPIVSTGTAPSDYFGKN